MEHQDHYRKLPHAPTPPDTAVEAFGDAPRPHKPIGPRFRKNPRARRTRVNLTLDPALYQQAREHCYATGMSVSEFVNFLLASSGSTFGFRAKPAADGQSASGESGREIPQ